MVLSVPGERRCKDPPGVLWVDPFTFPTVEGTGPGVDVRTTLSSEFEKGNG